MKSKCTEEIGQKILRDCSNGERLEQSARLSERALRR